MGGSAFFVSLKDKKYVCGRYPCRQRLVSSAVCDINKLKDWEGILLRVYWKILKKVSRVS